MHSHLTLTLTHSPSHSLILHNPLTTQLNTPEHIFSSPSPSSIRYLPTVMQALLSPPPPSIRYLIPLHPFPPSPFPPFPSTRYLPTVMQALERGPVVCSQLVAAALVNYSQRPPFFEQLGSVAVGAALRCADSHIHSVVHSHSPPVNVSYHPAFSTTLSPSLSPPHPPTHPLTPIPYQIHGLPFCG